MFSLLDINSICADNWNSFVETHPLGTVYHHRAWHEVIEKTYGFKTDYFISEADGKIISAVPLVLASNLISGKRFISYPFSDSCDPLISGSDEFNTIMAELESVRKKQGVKSLEFRAYRLAGIERKQEDDYFNFVLKLGCGTEALLRSLHKDCIQRPIKKALKNGLEIIEGTSLEHMRAFYELHLKTRRKQGVPVQPFRFFRNIWEILSPRGMASVLLASKDSQQVAGIVLLKYKDTAYYKFGASDPEFINLGPNQLLMWKAIESSANSGFRQFDFGRTFSGNTGLMEYKSRWGAEKIKMGYVFIPERRENLKREGSTLNRLASGMLKKMPVFSNRILGGLFYRYLA